MLYQIAYLTSYQVKKFSELDEEMVAYIKYEIGEYSEIVDDLVYLLNADSDYKISMNGATNIFNYPEFSDMGKRPSPFLNMLEERESLAR